jgi:hypothetical protein
MKKTGIVLFITLAALSFNSCSEKEKKEVESKNYENVSTENFDWLLGSWKRNNEAAGKETFEVWKKSNDSEYSAIGFTMQNNDTLSLEKIKLIKLAEKWFLVVQPQGAPEPVTFDMTSNNELEFICENKDNDFPKMIKYWKNRNKINALVSGDGMEILFEFERIVENKTSK